MSQSGLLNTTSGPMPPAVATSYVTDSGTAIPVANILNVLGGEGIDTTGSGNTVTISGEDATAGASAGLANKGIASFDSASFTVTAGFVSLLNPNGFPWTDVTSATQTLAVNNGYFTDRGAGVTYTLPATASLGDCIKIDGKLGLATVAQNANQAIRVGSLISTTGVGGSIVSTNVGDCITLRCSTAGASTIWIAETIVGNWTVV